MYVDDKDKLIIDEGDECMKCRKLLKTAIRCPLILAIGTGVCFINDDEPFNGQMFVTDCPMYEEKNLRLVEVEKDGT